MALTVRSKQCQLPNSQGPLFENGEGFEDLLNFGFDFSDGHFGETVEFRSNTSSETYSGTLCFFKIGFIFFIDLYVIILYNVDQDIESLPSSKGSCQSVTKRKKMRVKKSEKKGNGSKLDMSSVIMHQNITGLLPEEFSTSKLKKAPNLSRKFRGLKLYAFPSFDKCDSLLFFPSSMSRHLNSGDYHGLSSLMAQHLHRNCQVRISPTGNYRINALAFIKMFEIMNEAHPDSVLCVHTTKVVDNTINARMYFKFTDSQVINRSMALSVSDPTFHPMFAQQRSARFRDNMNLVNKSDTEKAALNAIVDSDVDLLVYGKVDLRLCFEDATKKVTDIDFMCEFTSLSTTQISAMMAGDEI